MDERSAITTFRGEWKELAKMMQESWAANKEQSLRYSQGFLRSAFAYPGSTLEMAPAIYAGGELVAFVAGFPRDVRFQGRHVRLLLNSFLTASFRVRKGGYGLMLWRALVDRARAAGYEGTINFCVEGDEMNTIMPSLARFFRLNTKKVYTIKYLSRFVRPAAAEAPAVVSTADIDLFLELAATIPESVPLFRVWTRAEAQWQCCGRSGAVAARLIEGDRRGMLTGYVAEVETHNAQPARVAIMEDLLWGNLESGECASLVRKFMHAASAQGCQSVSCPVLGYAPIEPLIAAGFRESKRVLHTYLTLWNSQEPDCMRSIYIDVL
jgi:hypothetical protein